MVSYEEIKRLPEVNTYIAAADKALLELGFTEHSFAHVGNVASRAAYILKTLGFDDKKIELVKIAAHLHDIGNLINRIEHSQSGAIMAFRILDHLDFEPSDVADIVSAIGNHDESTGVPVNEISAALILADKSDVRRSRVRNTDFATFDIHDRVNYSVTSSELTIDDKKEKITLSLSIDTSLGSIMDYFEIFMQRMLFCRKAAEKLGLSFKLIINDQPFI